jgi:aryl-alcohol dehydrogenase-like predicted oxidoreductase
MAKQPRRKKLGSSDMEVCEVCLGTMTFGAMTADEAECHKILDRYVELGGNFLDTAEMYPVPCKEQWFSRSEEIIGSWLSKRSDRADIIVATKVVGPRAGGQYMACPSRERALGGDPAAAPAEADLSHDQIMRACDASLKRLQTDYIDLYQARAAPHAALAGHAPAPPEPRCSGRMCMSRSAGDRARPAGDVACDSPHLDPREIGGRSGEIGRDRREIRAAGRHA